MNWRATVTSRQMTDTLYYFGGHITRLISSLSFQAAGYLNSRLLLIIFFIDFIMKLNENNENKPEPLKKNSFFSRISERISKAFAYASKGVWQDPRNTFKVRVVKVINLSIRSFFDRDLQNKSMSLTYSTVLAIVPGFALLFAIGRGFGFQNLLEEQLFINFPAQKNFISFALKFVDSYLTEASQGIFVGIGLLFLLYTLISLLFVSNSILFAISYGIMA